MPPFQYQCTSLAAHRLIGVHPLNIVGAIGVRSIGYKSKVVGTQQSFVQHCCVYRRVLLDLPNKAAPSFAQKTCFSERGVLPYTRRADQVQMSIVPTAARARFLEMRV